VRARAGAPSFLTQDVPRDAELRAFEIHMGHLHPRGPTVASTFNLTQRNGVAIDLTDGAVSADGTVVGTLLHGLFENPAVTGSLLDHLRRRRGLPTPGALVPYSRETTYERLADATHQYLGGPLLDRLAGFS
jgi:adenosylcobyric acid synthase